MDRGFDTEETLTRVYEEFFSKIYNYVYYQIHNRAVTDDLVSSIFMKVVEHIESFNEQKASFSTWIFTISRRVIIDYYRRSKVESDIDDYADTVQCSLSFEDAYRAYTEEENGDVEALMGILNEKERPVIFLRYFEGCSFEEIAAKLDKNSSTIRTIHERALKKMLTYLQQRGIRYEDVI